MGLYDNIEKTAFIGSDFLVWLWYMSEKNLGVFDVKDIGMVDLLFYDNLKLEKTLESGNESIVCKGFSSELKEARLGLTTGKELKEVKIKLIMDDYEWFFTLDSTFLDFKGLKTPKVEINSTGDEADEENRFFEKIALIEKAVNVIDNIFLTFIDQRMSEKWTTDILPAINGWRT